MKRMKSFILGKASEARSEERSVRHRKSVLLGGLIFFLFFGIFGFSQTAEAETITTESGEWKWEYWTSPPSKQTKVSYSFARVRNTRTGKLLSSGWHAIDNKNYYVSASGLIRDQFHGGNYIGEKMGEGTFTKGTKQTKYKWLKYKGGKWKYGTKNKKTFVKNRKVWIDGGLYIFDEDGFLPKAGWYQFSGKWYYVLKSGACALGWKKVSGAWFFFDYTTGVMVEKGCYDTKGVFAKKSHYYIFTPGGALKTVRGWQKGIDGYWYRSNKDGSAVFGWDAVDGKDYYFEKAQGGRMAVSGINGMECFQNGRHLKKNGVAEAKKYAWHEKDGFWWYGKGGTGLASQTACINGWYYYFNDDGYCVRGWNIARTKQTVYIKETEYDDPKDITWNDPIKLTNEELLLFGAVIYLEAGAESYRGQLAVANVVLNRLRSGRYGSTISDVIYAPYQFSVVGTKTFERMIKTGGSETALKAAKEALKGKNNIGSYVSFRMIMSYDITKLSDYKIIGNHVFFTE